MTECIKCKRILRSGYFDKFVYYHTVIDENGNEELLCSDCIEEDARQDKMDYRLSLKEDNNA